MLNKLQELRKKNGYSLQKMADLLNISKPFYHQIERGTRTLSYKNAIKISAVFNLKPDELFFEDLKETNN